MKWLAPAGREHVKKASLLLRLARALNLSRTSAIQKLNVSLRSGSVALRIVPKRNASVDLELWALEKERAYFREVFGRELSAAAA